MFQNKKNRSLIKDKAVITFFFLIGVSLTVLALFFSGYIEISYFAGIQILLSCLSMVKRDTVVSSFITSTWIIYVWTFFTRLIQALGKINLFELLLQFYLFLIASIVLFYRWEQTNFWLTIIFAVLISSAIYWFEITNGNKFVIFYFMSLFNSLWVLTAADVLIATLLLIGKNTQARYIYIKSR